MSKKTKTGPSLSPTLARKLAQASGEGGFINLKEYSTLKESTAQILCGDADMDLSGLTELTPELAKAFSLQRGDLRFNGVKSLSLETLEALKEHVRCTLTFGGVEAEALSDEMAMILAQRQWRFGDDGKAKTIFPAIEKFPDTPGFLSLLSILATGRTEETLGLTEISKKQAEILTKKAYRINLPRLQSLSPEAAAELAKSKEEIILEGLETLDKDTAKALAQHPNELRIPRVKTADEETVAALAQHMGPVSAESLCQSMPDTPAFEALAATLVSRPSKWSFRIEQAGDNVAGILSAKPDILLSLRAIGGGPGMLKLVEAASSATAEWPKELNLMATEISDKAMGTLAQSPKAIKLHEFADWGAEPSQERLALAAKLGESGNALDIKGSKIHDSIAGIWGEKAKEVYAVELEELDDAPGHVALAAKLGGYQSKLKKAGAKALASLNETLRKASKDTLESVNRECLGVLFPANSRETVWMDSLKELGNEEAQWLTENQAENGTNIVLKSVESVTNEVAETLGNGRGNLSLLGVKVLSDEALQGLAERKGVLELGLETLNETQAKILSGHKGGLKLNKLIEISKETLEILAKTDPESELRLNGLRSIPADVAAVLAARQGAVGMDGIEELSEEPGHLALAKKMTESWDAKHNLKKVAVPAAEVLATGVNKKYPAITELGPEVARAFTRQSGANLELPGLNGPEISPETAEVLGGPNLERLTLGSIDGMDPEILDIVAKNKKSITIKATKLTPEAAKALAAVQEYIYLNELDHLDGEAALPLKGYKGILVLEDLKSVDREAAKILSKMRSRFRSKKAGEWAVGKMVDG